MWRFEVSALIRIAICDDDITSLEIMYELVTTHLNARAYQEEIAVRRFQSAYDLLECVENPNLHFDIYFLDIIMPMYTGIELARYIRRDDEYAVIIYTTASPEFALDAAGTSPLQYLVKPINRELLWATLDAALRRLDNVKTRKVLVKFKGGLANIGMHQIEYIEYRDHMLVFHLTSGETISSRVMQESFSSIAERTFNDERFVKPHASYVVNMDHVEGMNNNEFEMRSGAVVRISKRILSQVKQQFIDYMVKKNDAIVM